MKCLVALVKRPTKASTTSASIPEPAASEHDTPITDGSSHLQKLPPEIRRQVLAMLDLPSLKAMVQASPTFHQQYISERRYILCRSLEWTLNEALVDAYALHLCSVAVTKATATAWGEVGEFIGVKKIYEDAASGLGQRGNNCGFTQDEAIEVANFYLRLVKPVLDYFTRYMQDELAALVADHDRDSKSQVFGLTHTEMLRFTRATYRYQVMCQVGGRQVRDMRYSRDIRRGEENNIESLFDLLQPWEVEEVVSFYQFAQHECGIAINHVTWDLHQDNPRFDGQGRPPTPEGAFDLSNSWYLDNHIEGAAFCGLSLLYTILFEREDHEGLVKTMQDHLYSSYIPMNTSEGMLGSTSQTLRRNHERSERDQMQDERAPLPFQGDCTEGKAEALPPLAWTMIWGGTYSNLYGCFIPDAMRRWGYVYWDAETLTRNGGEKVLMQQWELEWEGDDPRDDFL